MCEWPGGGEQEDGVCPANAAIQALKIDEPNSYADCARLDSPKECDLPLGSVRRTYRRQDCERRVIPLCSSTAMKTLHLAALLGLGLATSASAQVIQGTGPVAGANTFLDFDNPFVASGPISSTAPEFTMNGIASVSLVGAWLPGGDTLTGASNVMGQGLVSQNGVLTVGAAGDPLDNAGAGDGFDIVLLGATNDFSVLFIDQVNMNYDVELFSGATSLGVGSFNYAGGFPNPPHSWSLMSGSSFDRILITFPGGSGGVGLDEFSFDGSGGTIGASYCGPAPSNSTGGPGLLISMGSSLVADNNLTLTANDLPPNQFGYFLNSQVQGFIPMPGGSQGNLCLAGAIGRYNGAGQILNSGTGGTFSLLLDLTNTPTPGAAVTVFPGETWNFQCWFRDVNPGAASNFTNGLAVSFN